MNLTEELVPAGMLMAMHSLHLKPMPLALGLYATKFGELRWRSTCFTFSPRASMLRPSNTIPSAPLSGPWFPRFLCLTVGMGKYGYWSHVLSANVLNFTKCVGLAVAKLGSLIRDAKTTVAATRDATSRRRPPQRRPLHLLSRGGSIPISSRSCDMRTSYFCWHGIDTT